MFTITFQASNFSDLKSQIQKMAEELLEGEAHEPVAKSDETVAVQRETKPAKTTLTKTKPATTSAAPKKETKVAAKKEVVEENIGDLVEDDATLPPVKITKEVVATALKQVNDEVSFDKAREVLKEFGCLRLSELPEKKYQEFFDACREAIQ